MGPGLLGTAVPHQRSWRVFKKPIAGHDPILNRVEPCGSSHAEGGALDSAEMWCKLPGNSSKQLGHFLGK